ncbi:hypothetical protein Ctob_014432, partial [Chrysochromulina tobinii]
MMKGSYKPHVTMWSVVHEPSARGRAELRAGAAV